MAKSVMFNGIYISSGNYTVRKVMHDTATPRDLYMYDLARDGGSILVNNEWKPKKIVVEGIIKGEDIDNLEANCDEFKRIMGVTNKNLDIEYSSGTRRYLASANVIQIERDYYHLNYAPYTIEFVVPDGHGRTLSPVTYMTQSIVLHTLEDVSFGVSGTIAPKYTIELNFEVATDVVGVSVTINGDRVTVNETITAGQIVLIDAENKKITIDGVEKPYTGLFPRLVLGTNDYLIATQSTSHLYDVEVTYTPKFL